VLKAMAQSLLLAIFDAIRLQLHNILKRKKKESRTEGLD
jgi:hypothetical protein